MRNLLVVAVALTLAAGAWADGPFRDSLDYAEGDPGPAIAEYQRVCDSLKARDRAIDSMLQDWREQQANTGVRLARASSHIKIGRLLTDDDILVPRGDSLVWDSIIPDQLRRVVCTTVVSYMVYKVIATMKFPEDMGGWLEEGRHLDTLFGGLVHPRRYMVDTIYGTQTLLMLGDSVVGKVVKP